MRNISDKKRIVIKLGTSTLAHSTGKLNIRRMTNLVRVISDLHNSGKEIIMVSSGAVGLGTGKLGLAQKPSCCGCRSMRTYARLRRYVRKIQRDSSTDSFD